MQDWLPWLIAGAAAVLGAASLLRRTGPASRRRAPERPPGTRPPVRRRPVDRATGGRAAPVTDQPDPGQIWWADVPFDDGTGRKVRPCLVLRVDRHGADVLKITSQDKSRRSDHIRIPTRTWDASARHDSYLDLSQAIRIRRDDFEEYAGACDDELWQWIRRMRHLAGQA